MRIEKVNWNDEKLEGNNEGFIFGLYYYDDTDNPFPQDCEWFKTEEDRELALRELQESEG